MDNLVATRTTRIISYIIDSILLAFIILPVTYFYFNINNIDLVTANVNETEHMFIWQYPIKLMMLEFISLIIVALYFALLPLFLDGQTFGRKIMNIKLVNEDGTPISAKNIIVREILLLTIINSLTGGLFFFIGSLFILRDSKITLYDTLSKTKMIDV